MVLVVSIKRALDDDTWLVVSRFARGSGVVVRLDEGEWVTSLVTS